MLTFDSLPRSSISSTMVYHNRLRTVPLFLIVDHRLGPQVSYVALMGQSVPLLNLSICELLALCCDTVHDTDSRMSSVGSQCVTHEIWDASPVLIRRLIEARLCFSIQP